MSFVGRGEALGRFSQSSLSFNAYEVAQLIRQNQQAFKLAMAAYKKRSKPHPFTSFSFALAEASIATFKLWYEAKAVDKLELLLEHWPCSIEQILPKKPENIAPGPNYMCALIRSYPEYKIDVEKLLNASEKVLICWLNNRQCNDEFLDAIIDKNLSRLSVLATISLRFPHKKQIVTENLSKLEGFNVKQLMTLNGNNTSLCLFLDPKLIPNLMDCIEEILPLIDLKTAIRALQTMPLTLKLEILIQKHFFEWNTLCPAETIRLLSIHLSADEEPSLILAQSLQVLNLLESYLIDPYAEEDTMQEELFTVPAIRGAGHCFAQMQLAHRACHVLTPFLSRCGCKVRWNAASALQQLCTIFGLFERKRLSTEIVHAFNETDNTKVHIQLLRLYKKLGTQENLEKLTNQANRVKPLEVHAEAFQVALQDLLQ